MFISFGAIYALVGTVGTVIYFSGAVRLTKQFFLGETIDPLLLRKSPRAILNESPQIARYIELAMIGMWSFSAGMGVLQLGVAYFGLRSGQPWALWTSGISTLLMLSIYWSTIIIPVVIRLRVSYWRAFFLHPYAFVPTILFPVAMILGWMALRT
jgi:hypothetical protein